MEKYYTFMDWKINIIKMPILLISIYRFNVINTYQNLNGAFLINRKNNPKTLKLNHRRP